MRAKQSENESAKSRRLRERSLEERNRAWVRRALKEGFAPLTAADLEGLATGTPEEGEQIRRVSAELRAVRKSKRKRKRV